MSLPGNTGRVLDVRQSTGEVSYQIRRAHVCHGSRFLFGSRVLLWLLSLFVFTSCVCPRSFVSAWFTPVCNCVITPCYIVSFVFPFVEFPVWASLSFLYSSLFHPVKFIGLCVSWCLQMGTEDSFFDLRLSFPPGNTPHHGSSFKDGFVT